jgi:tetratricopeptide (TPR) repeat protein
MKSRWKYLLSIAAILLAAGGAYFYYVHGAAARAQRMARLELWSDARQELRPYLWFYPFDYQTRLLLADTYIKDESLELDAAQAGALKHLRAIPDSSPEGAWARLQEGRVLFVLLHQPSRAEELIERSLKLDPESSEAHYLMWKLLDLTGRSHLAEPHFWKTYESSQGAERAARLREWHMSQFYPATANLELERLMGMPPDRDAPPEQNEAFRFIRYRNAERDRPLGYAALARSFQSQGDLQFASLVLDEGDEAIEVGLDDPSYLAAAVAVSIELGDFERAEQAFQRWPEPHAGYEYLSSRAMVLHEVRRDYAEALKAYELALQDWPGPIDSRLLNRKAECLALLRQPQAAAEARAAAKSLEELMSEEVHLKLRDAMGHLDDPRRVAEIVDFYRKIGREREAKAWETHLALLNS